MATVDLPSELSKELAKLTPEQRLRVLDFARSLTQQRPRGVPGASLLRFAGSMSAADAAEIAKAIEADCERIDEDGW